MPQLDKHRSVIARDVRSPKYRLRVALHRQRIANKRAARLHF
jgi:hypothetical protein